MNKALIVAIILLATHFSVIAQDTRASLSGQLLEANGKTALVGANVQLITVRDTTIHFITSTDGQGYFSFKDLTPTFYKIRYSSIGYKTGEKLVRVTSPATDLKPFIVEEDSEMLNEN